jgi:6-pyruvoyltetrahydropterin/6-carboxytetrahydropterin synthase
MTKIRISKEFSFEMAHALWNYDGPCKNIHGHSYELQVTIIGEPVGDKKSPKFGMVVDFGDLKNLVKEKIIKKFDHALLVYSEADTGSIKAGDEMFGKLQVMDFQPTCENLLIYMAENIMKELPSELKLHSLKLRETGTSFAEWYSEDN